MRSHISSCSGSFFFKGAALPPLVNQFTGGKMFFNNENNRKIAAQWVIAVVSVCVLIYLAIRHIQGLSMAVLWCVDIVSPLLTGFIIAIILNVPLCTIENKFLDKKFPDISFKTKRMVGILLSLLAIIIVGAGVAIVVIPKIADTFFMLKSILDTGFNQLSGNHVLENIGVNWSELQSELNSWIENAGVAFISQAISSVKTIVNVVVDLFIGLIFSIYILSNKETLKKQLYRLMSVWRPTRFVDAVSHISSVFNYSFKMFLTGQSIEALILGIMCMIGMLILNIPYAPMVGALVGVTAFIPYIGGFIGGGLGALMIVTVNPWKALIFLIYLVVLQQVEGNLIYPRVVGAKISLHPMWVLAAITIGGNIAGPLGMFLGVPAASATYTLVKEATEKREMIKKGSCA